ncbi:CBS domain-containing protein [Bradyrhizobium elkanii]|uniref:CBS domain-containing protein n=1 Tax=Bradyrhizobium elkanii TaxID=29448 RepID=A0A8I1Y5D8_BRAEL|nr:CBS domain-containing protein [Bradyrhizobium elkanii]
MYAHQIMARKVPSTTPDSTILDAANIMLRHHVSGLPVVDRDGAIAGIVTEGDFLHRSEIGTERKRNWLMTFILGPGKWAEDYVSEHGRKVSEIMTRAPVTVAEDAPLTTLVELMEKKRQAAAGDSRRQTCRHYHPQQPAANGGESCTRRT